VECVTSNRRLDFETDLDHDADPGIFTTGMGQLWEYCAGPAALWRFVSSHNQEAQTSEPIRQYKNNYHNYHHYGDRRH